MAIRAAKKKKRVQPQLTAEKVRDEALRLIEAEGIEEFSTRKLGRALGVEAMAIYWYYPSKDALLDAVVENLVSKMGVAQDAPAFDEDADWIDGLRKVAYAYRGIAHEYPNAFPLLASRRFATEQTFRFLDGLFASARKQGYDDKTVARFFRLVSSYCSGAALDELAGNKEAKAGAADAAALRAKFPHLVEVSQWLAPAHFDEVFAFGLEVLLAALVDAPRKGKAGKPRK